MRRPPDRNILAFLLLMETFDVENVLERVEPFVESGSPANIVIRRALLD